MFMLSMLVMLFSNVCFENDGFDSHEMSMVKIKWSMVNIVACHYIHVHESRNSEWTIEHRNIEPPKL